jgi:glycosyltransferase involved in cell wall biosynthesis
MSRPLRLLLIINRLAPVGGAESQLLHLSKGLAGHGHEVTVCCIDRSWVEPEELGEHGVRLLQLGVERRSRRATEAVPRLARLAAGADVVHCTMWDSSLWGRLAAIAARKPAIVADHATDRAVQLSTNGDSRASWIARHNRLLDRFTFATVACATSQRPVLIGEGVDPDKIVHIPNGIPVEQLRREAGGGDRAALGLSGDGPVAMHVGLFRPEKNQLGALEAFSRVRAEVPDAEIVFVGDGVARAEVERRAVELGAGKWAHFLGNRFHVPPLLGAADLSLLSSTSDAMPMTVLEAMALGLPTVATDVGDVGQVLAGGAGICVPPEDAGAFAAACTKLLSDPELRRQMGATAAAQAAQFDASVMVSRYEALFEAACSGGSPLAAVAAVDPDATTGALAS